MTSAGSFSVNMAQPSAAASRNAAWPVWEPQQPGDDRRAGSPEMTCRKSLRAATLQGF